MFELDGVQYSLEDLQAAAQKYNMGFEEYMEKMRAKGLAEVAEETVVEQTDEQETFEDPFLQSAKKIYGPVEEVAVAEPVTTIEQPDTELLLEDTSLDLPKETKLIDYTANISDEIFSKPKEESQYNLKKLFPSPNIDFEQAGFGTDKIKIKYTDPETDEVFESKLLQFDTDNEKEIARNKKIINDFYNEHFKGKDVATIQAEQDRLLRQAIEKKDSYVPEDVKNSIKEKFNSPDLFNERTETIVIPSTMYGAPATSVTTRINPYEKELNAEIAKLKKNNPDTSSEEIEKTAKQNVRIYLEQLALADAKSKYVEEAISKEGEVDMPAFGPYGLAGKMLKTFVQKQKTKKVQADVYVPNLLATAKLGDIADRFDLTQKTLGQMNDIVSRKASEPATQEEYDSVTENLKALGYKYEPTEEDITLGNGRVVNKGFLNAFQYLYNSLGAENEIYKGFSLNAIDAAELYQDVALVSEASGKNYDLAEKYAANIGLGFSDIGIYTLYLGSKVLALSEYASPFGYMGVTPMNDALDNLAVKYSKTANDIRSSYTRDVSFDEAFSSADKFGKFAMQEVTNQIPILIAMMASGGAAAYVVGASSAGNKMADMRTQLALGTSDYKESEIWLKSLGYGVFEGGFAALTTVPILNRAKATWAKSGKGSVIDNTSKTFIKQKSPGLIYEPILESAGEVGTIGAQNLIDGNSFTDGMDHAGFSGAAFGLLFAGIPFLKGLHTSSFSDYNADIKIRDLKASIGKLAAARENLVKAQASESAIAGIDEQISVKSNELANEINTQEEAIKNLVTHKFGERITGIVEAQSNLKIQAKQTLEDTSIDDATKKSRINTLQAEYTRLQNIKDTALSDTFKRKFEGEFKALEGTDKQAYDGYLSEAKEALYQEKNNADSTPDEVFRKAHDLYLLDKVQEANNKLKNFKGFKIFKTQEEAITAIEKNNNISDADKADLIENIKNGDDGAAYRKGDERLMYVVEENQVLNQRKYIATHEVGHDVFWDILGTDPAAFEPIARQLLEGTKNVDEKLYKELSKETQSIEVVSRFLELVAGGNVDFRKNEKKKGLAGLFGAMVQKTFEGDYDFDFKGETDMFNFVVGIGKKIADGSLTTTDIKAAKKGVIAQEAKGRVIPLPTFETRTKLTRAASAAKGKDLMQSLNKFSQNEDGSAKFASKEEWQRSSEAGEAYFTVQQTSLLDGEIRKQARLKGLPEDIDIDEIKDNIALRVFENFDPSKNNLFGYLLGKVNIVEKAVLDAAKKFGTQVESTAARIDTAAGDAGAVAEIEADVTTVEEKQEREAKEEAEEASTFNLTTSKAIEPATIEKAKAKVLSIVRTLKNKLGQAVSKNVNTVPVVKEVIQSSAKSIDIDLKKQMGGKGGLKLRKFVIDNKADIINNASATWLMGKDTGTEVKGGMPIAIEKSVGGTYTGKTIEINVGGKTVKVQEFKPNFVPYPEWVGKKIDREKTVERGQTSGNEIVRKVNPAKISDNAFADFVTTEDGTPIRGRKESLANELAGRLGGQIFKEAMADPDSDISKAFEQNQDLRGAVLSDNFRNEVIEQTERGLIARSEAEVVQQAIGAMTRATNTERAAALENIKSKLSPEAFEKLHDNIIGPFLDVMEDIDEGGWYVAEQKAIDTFNELQKLVPGLKITQVKPTGDPTAPDVVFEYDGVSINWEIKKGKNARLSQMYISDWSGDSPSISRNIKQEYKDQILEAEKSNKGVKKYIDQLENGKYSDQIKFDGKKWIMPSDVYYALQRLGFQKNATTKLTMPTDLVSDLYKEKNTFYIGFTDIGNFSLGANPAGINLPPFSGEVNVNIKFKPFFRKDGTVSVSRVAYPSLTTKTANDLAKVSNSSVYSTASMKNLFESINPATIESLKNKPVVDQLNKQYDRQQKGLKARSKGKLSPEFNRIIERASGIGARKKLSGVVARRMGKNKDIFRLFLPPSAEDFRGLYYSMLGSGRQGEADKRFFKENLVGPYTRGIAAMEKAKQALMNDYKALRKMFREDMKVAGFKNLNAKVPGMELSIDQAVRIYLWTEANLNIPQLTETDQKKAVEFVFKNPILQAYANGLLAISKQDSWAKPDEYWDARTILSDLTEIALNTNRKKYLEEFIANKNEIFSEENLNKIEAAFGKNTRESFEDILYRMETGSNKPSGGDTIAKKWNNWLNNSVGAIMFFNRRSATLQLLSTANFMNTGDNNPLKAALAFANQPQYWKDWATIFNSPKLKERRGGLKSDVQEAEIAAAARDAKNKPLAIISYLLKIGFTPTQIADSVAIASGGAAFYRNRINTYKKKGFDQAEAEAKAWEDFSEISDETQQSGDPMLISKQQASLMGRIILAFQNTPMQITRMQKRDFQDLINRRRIEGKNQFQSDMTYLSRITYYAAIQNLIFSTLQNGLFTLLPGFDDEEEQGLTEKEIEALRKKDEQKVQNVLNSMLDTTLRGSGLYGAVASTIKNVIIEYMRQQEKDPFAKDNARVVLQAINISPPLGSKARKFYNALETMDYEKDVIDARGFGMTIDGKFQLSPSYQVLGNLASATINLPLDRVVSEVDAIAEALDSRNTDMQRIAMALGWKAWEVGAEIEEHETIKTTASETRKAEGIQKRKEKAAAKRKIEQEANQGFTPEERGEYLKWKRNNKGKRLYDYLEETNQL
jgi:hypothetical protein